MLSILVKANKMNRMVLPQSLRGFLVTTIRSDGFVTRLYAPGAVCLYQTNLKLADR